MQAYLLDNPEILNIDETYNEVQIYEEEIPILQGGVQVGRNGRIDIIASYSGEHIAIMELKKGQLTQDALCQLEGYLGQKQELLELDPRIISADQTDMPKWIGILIGGSIESELETRISEGYTFDGIPIAAMTIERFRGSSGHVYVTTDTYFSNQQLAQDRTQYTYNGNAYGKGRLVLAVMQAHVAGKPDITFSELSRDFPNTLQGSMGVFASIEDANELYSKNGVKRHFIKDSEVIALKTGHIAISSQWGIGNIGNFIEKARELGHTIEY